MPGKEKCKGRRIIPLTAEGHSIWVFFSVSTKASMSKGLEQDLSGVVLGPFSLCNSIFLKKIFLISFYLLIFWCFGSLLLHRLLSSCGKREPLPSHGAQVSPCGGLPGCKALLLGHTGLSGCGSRALEHRLNICGTRA